MEYLHYPGEGPPLVLLHATGFFPWLWHPIARELSRDYSVIAPQLWGHRDADPDKGGLAWPVLAKDLAVLLKKLGISRPLVVGHSMGGTVTVLANTLFGVDSAGMVLVEPIFLPDEVYKIRIRVDQHPLAGKAIKRRNLWKDKDEARQYMESKSFFASWDKEMLDLYLEHGLVNNPAGGLVLACSPRVETSLFMGSSWKNPWPLLEKVTGPVLVVEGQTSDNRTFIDYKKATALFADGKYHCVEQAGHVAPMEKPGQTLDLIRNFF